MDEKRSALKRIFELAEWVYFKYGNVALLVNDPIFQISVEREYIFEQDVDEIKLKGEKYGFKATGFAVSSAGEYEVRLTVTFRTRWEVNE